MFKDKIACITGSARGLGLEMAMDLAKKGATVIVNDIEEKMVDEAVNIIRGKNLAAYGFVANVANKEEVKKMMNFIKDRFGRLDILVNNAGGELRTPKKLLEIQEEHWDLVIDVNLKGTFLCSQAAVEMMKGTNEGCIINVSSIGGRSASIVTGVAYAAAKGGIISFTRRLAKEVGVWNIRVNAIAPGLVLSGERLQQTWEGLSKEEQDSLLEDIPLKRLGTLEEQAKVVSFLASNDAKYITGAIIDVNGGRFMG